MRGNNGNLWAAVFVAVVACTLMSAMTFGKSAAPDKVMSLDPSHTAAHYIACLDTHGVTLVSAHRGGFGKGYPENALESLQKTVAYGPMLVEVDVRETADGHLVLLHDSTLDRTTNGTGELSDYTLKELQGLRLKDKYGTETSFTIPTLESVLKWADERAIIQLDVKRGIDFAKVARAVVAADAVDSVLIIAYGLKDVVTTLAVDKRLSFSVTIRNIAELQALEKAGLPREQILAWTGVVKSSHQKPIWQTLDELNIPSAAGALWELEEQIVASGDPMPYMSLSKGGVDVIAADYYQLAFDTLNAQQDLNAAIAACKGS